MKTVLLTRQFILLLSFIILGRSVQAQTIPELVFQNPVLISGTAGADNATYLFSNVGPNLDAVIKIISRSSASVILGNIDTVEASIGYNKALQPVLGIPGTAPANTTWWMKFNCAFYDAGTNNKAKLSQFSATGLDVDGDGLTTFEWQEMYRIDKIDTSLVNNLTFSLLSHHVDGDDYRITGIIANSPGIDTSALNVMGTYTFKNQDNFDFLIGATTTAFTTTAGMRLNALWFKQFNWSQLPLKLISFSAMLNNSNTDLTWRTVSETNVSHFEIEKSLDGRNFSEAGIVFAKGNETDITTYSFSDAINTDKEGVVYYRIRSVDMDGKCQYSDVRIIRISKQTESNISIHTYPNPVIRELRISIPANWQNKKVIYEVINATGHVSKKIESGSSSQTETVNIDALAPGFYFVRVSCDGQTAQQKIVKQ
jgi:Secretion system C-terminal sorting domain